MYSAILYSPVVLLVVAVILVESPEANLGPTAVVVPQADEAATLQEEVEEEPPDDQKTFTAKHVLITHPQQHKPKLLYKQH